MVQSANCHRRHVEFDMVDLVWVKPQPYRQLFMKHQHSVKLSPCWFSLFAITQCTGPIAYKLELPYHAKIHPVFHISLLKKFVGSSSTVVTPFLLASSTHGLVVSLIDVVDVRVKIQGQWLTQLLICWDGRDELTWESFDQLL